MTNIVTIQASYSCSATGTVDLSPHTWEDVDKWYVKWDLLHVRLKGADDWTEFDMLIDSIDSIDWKRPAHVDVYEGENEFEKELASTD